MNITTDYLVSLAACQEGIDAFLSIFPDGEVELSSDNISKALSGDLNVAWLIERINDQQTLAEMSKHDSVRASVAINQNTPADALAELSQDKSYLVRSRVASNQNTPTEALAELSKDEHYLVRDAVTKNPTYKGAQTA